MFELNQIFINEYPPEAADWCNESGEYHIERIEDDTNGSARYQIIENKKPTEEELADIALAQATSIEARLAAMEDALAEMMEAV